MFYLVYDLDDDDDDDDNNNIVYRPLEQGDINDFDTWLIIIIIIIIIITDGKGLRQELTSPEQIKYS